MSAEVIETPLIGDTVKPEENNPPAVLNEINTTNNTEIAENVAKNKPNKTGKNRKNNNNNNNNNKRLNNAQQKNNKNWKINKFNKRQYDKKEIESIRFDKNNRKYGPMLKFKNNNNNRGGQRWIPIIPGAISKFFLPEKLPRKELIIPPTKFLLGGNISDPLNLNSLQDEAMNRSMNAATPKSSPMTTPPKIEIILPPNIHDPLHLLDPVDTFEYNKQLISPMKRKAKHRNRKRKKIPKKSNVSPDLKDDCDSSKNDSIKTDGNDSIVSNSSIDIQIPGTSAAACSSTTGTVTIATTSTVVVAPIEPDTRRSVDQEKVVRDLRLELSDCVTSNSVPIIGQRKRRISESHLNNKNKVRRMDSMDKIVSPVIPQPGGWKRPPRVLPSGSRNRMRTTSTTTSGTEDITPTDPKKEIDLNVSEKSESESGGEKIITAVIMETDEKKENVTKTKLPTEAKYQYGNYNRYYGRRNLNENTDVRLKVFMKHPYLFKHKDVLDVGCNAGHITIEVAKELEAKSVTGIDIDKDLIARARKNLSLYVRIPVPPKPVRIFDVINPMNTTTTNSVTTTITTESVIQTAIPSTSSQDADKIKTAKITSPKLESIKSDLEIEKVPLEITKNPTEPELATANLITVTKKEELIKEPPPKKFKLNRRRKTKTGRQKLAEKSNFNPHEFFPISFPICYGPIPDLIPDTERFTSKTVFQFPRNVYFRTANYVVKDESCLSGDSQQYDLIMCLSLTKWIHLNFGDAGLKLAFKRMFNQLRPGGKLILEAQNWASYKKKKKLTETIYNNYCTIEFYPNKFHEYLLSPEVGFSHSYLLGVPRHLSKGFKRPIQLYVKGDFTPSQIRWSDTYQSQTPSEPYKGIYAYSMSSHRQPETPTCGNRSYRYTPTNVNRDLTSYISPFYNPGTDSYLPSYDFCFPSPVYLGTASPPAASTTPPTRSKKSSSYTPAYGSVRENETDEQYVKHVYPPSTIDYNMGKSSVRSVNENDLDKSPKTPIYSPSTNQNNSSVRENDNEEGLSSKRGHVYSVTIDSEQLDGGGDNSRSVENSPRVIEEDNSQDVESN